MLNRLAMEISTALRRSVGLSQPRLGRRYTISNLLDIHRATRSDAKSTTFDIKSMQSTDQWRPIPTTAKMASDVT
jgi:hypothetical protein